MLTLLGNTQTKGLAPAQTTIIIHLRSKQFVIYQSGNLLPISVTFIFGLPTGFYSRLPTFSPHGDLNLRVRLFGLSHSFALEIIGATLTNCSCSRLRAD
jgi:hypothetical protein